MHSGSHVTFLIFDITVQDNKFVYKLYDKRDDFPFSIVRIPFIDSNIPQSIFYSALVGEFLRIARSTLLLNDFTNKAKMLCRGMFTQGANLDRMKYSIKKIILRHPSDFAQFNILPTIL